MTHQHHKEEHCKACSCADGLQLSQHHHEGEGHSHDHGPHTQQILWTIVAFSSAFLVVALAIDHFQPTWWGMPWLRLVAYLVAFLPVGIHVLLDAWTLSVHDRDYFNECTLMTIAAAGAFAIGEYPEAVLLMVLYNIGEILQTKAVTKAKKSISDLVDIRTEEVMHLLPDGSEEMIAARDAEPGFLLRVRVGERLALDGTLTSAHALLDLSALTGESVPAELTEDDRVLAGSVVLGHPIEMRVTKPYEESTLARILQMAEKAAERKPDTERFIRRFARVYTPIVIALALLVVLVPWVVSLVYSGFTYVFADWLYRSLVFLVTSCPCALIIAVPLTYFSGIGAASRHGILFKGAIFLEKIRHATSVVFDKTGTITEGTFEVTEVLHYGDFDQNEALALLAAVEQNSTHPIAQAIIRHAEEQALSKVEVTEVQELAGFGLEARDTSGHLLRVGSDRLMQEAGLELPPSSDLDRTAVHLAVENQVVLTVVLEDKPKPTAVATVNELRLRGLSPVVILSGDKPAVVERVGAEIGVDRAYGGLLPQDKMAHVESLMQEEQKEVIFVGDGLNDAPVMSMTDVGVAMGGIASDATIEAADVVIQGTDPFKVVQAWDLSLFTHKVVMQNITFSLGFKFVVMLLALFGIASLTLAVIADVGVTLLAVLNAMRVLRFRAIEAR